MKKTVIFLLFVLSVSITVFADLPFRNQRRDMFRTLTINEKSIVFMGNSITQGNEWSELFSNDPRVVNRGISGNTSEEIRNNLDYIIAGKPAKVFLMIGINDGPDPAIVVPAIQKTIEILQNESPSTQIFVQSILPCRGRDKVQITNQLIQDVCRSMGVKYIDINSRLADKSNSGELDKVFTNDQLHLLGPAYKKWTEGYREYTGIVPRLKNVKPKMIVSASHPYVNQRVTLFQMLPASNKDILMLGDYHVNTCEWRELLHYPQVKNRGIGVGLNATNIGLKELKEMVPLILHHQPAKVFVSCGSKDLLYNGLSVDEAIAAFSEVLKTIRAVAPRTRIYMQSLIPVRDPQMNTTQIIPFNRGIAQLAAADKNIYFVDVFSALVDQNVLSADLAFADRGLNGKGYMVWAKLLKPLIYDGRK